MANIIHSTFSFLLILNIILLSFSCYALAARNIPNSNPKISDKKQPNTFEEYDGTVLIPGFGRIVVPPKGTHVNPFTYNPITGTNTGSGLIIPNPGTGINIPGGDGTFVHAVGNIPAPP